MIVLKGIWGVVKQDPSKHTTNTGGQRLFLGMPRDVPHTCARELPEARKSPFSSWRGSWGFFVCSRPRIVLPPRPALPHPSLGSPLSHLSWVEPYLFSGSSFGPSCEEVSRWDRASLLQQETGTRKETMVMRPSEAHGGKSTSIWVLSSCCCSNTVPHLSILGEKKDAPDSHIQEMGTAPTPEGYSGE